MGLGVDGQGQALQQVVGPDVLLLLAERGGWAAGDLEDAVQGDGLRRGGGTVKRDKTSL